MSILCPFDPILVGTIPIGIDIPGSDLDIICHTNDTNIFRGVVLQYFSEYKSFSDYMNDDLYVANFEYKDIPFEIYATNIATTSQYGYRHMIIEHRILELSNAGFREDILHLKKSGYKTEPAFGYLLNMKSPYSDLISLEKLPDKDLLFFIKSRLKKE
ncbi:DUF4269 domain-containing protein [Dysgonomonas sp. Marseille-P4677]|nr:DUF4269 domain-containing protein [Dysgonomonas sp. Marseille-P4677]